MQANLLQLDQATLKDLEVFDSEQTSLYEFCNTTRTFGGARLLRKRMAQPFSDPEDIQKVQESIRFIVKHREAFKKMPSAFMADKVDHYTHEVLPIVLQEGKIEFTAAALSLWINHDRHYTAISVGVQMTCSFLASLRNFVGGDLLGSATGELGEIVSKIQELLEKPKIKAVPDTQVGGWAWQVIRLDQVFRAHEKSVITELQTLLHEIDALVAMADVTRNHNYVIPDLLTGETSFKAEGLTHPFVVDAVPNSMSMDQSHRVQFLTGPNMAGKTTYLRSIATALYFAHLGMGVPATRFEFVPVESLFTSISLSDDLRGGVSYFRAEALRVKAIATAVAANKRVIALMDEPFKGTNVKDALDASRAMLDRFVTKEQCLFIVASHLIELQDQFLELGKIDFRFFEADESEGKLRFDYTLRAGVSAQRLGMRVLEEEGVFELLGKSEQ